MTAPATPRVTRDGKTLSARMWAYLEASYRAAGADPARYLHVSQGSYRADDPVPASGTTHNGGGAADLRTWNLPDAVQADLCRRLVVELRRRGGCAWYRDDAHGGFAPHIHVILRDEPGLSSSAAWQCREYDAGRNGLTGGGRDYHPRPPQETFRVGLPVVHVVARAAVTRGRAAAQLGVSVARFLRFNPRFIAKAPRPGDAGRGPPGGRVVDIKD